MSTLAPFAAVNPYLRLILFEWPQRESLEFWLKNPLILAAMPGKVAATKEQLGGWTDKRCMQAVMSLRKERDRLRNLTAVPVICMSSNELVGLLDHPLVSDYERKHSRSRCFALHPLERAWEAERIRQVLAAREVAAWEQAENQ